jgi:hypothetical protein
LKQAESCGGEEKEEKKKKESQQIGKENEGAFLL